MHTPEIPDDELDALFQQGFERFPEEHSLAEWWRLQEKLQAQALEQQVRRRVRRVLAVELLLLSLGALLWLAWPVVTHSIVPRALLAARALSPSHRYPSAAHATRRRPRPQVPEAPAERAQSLGKASAPRIAAPSGPAAAAGPAAAGSAPVLEATPPRRDSAKAPAAVRAVGPLVLAAPRSRIRAHQSPEVDGAHPAVARPEYAILSDEPANPPSADAVGRALPGQAPAGSRPAIRPLAGLVAQVARPELSPVPTPLAGGAMAPEWTPPAAPWYRLSIAAVGATALSAVRLARLMPPGQSVGLKVEYRLTPRLRVSTGVVRTHQIFDADGPDYAMPASTSPPGAALTWVSGAAQALDLPLNLRYDLLAQARATWFASAGVSSVLMRNEHYRYDYLVNGQTEQAETSQVNGSQHLFSNLNLSMGYERPLGQGRWAAQVEPFIKLPLRGVGMGQVMLSSAGVQLALKYGVLPARARR